MFLCIKHYSLSLYFFMLTLLITVVLYSMCVLGSRERMCISPNIPPGKSKTEFCREALDPLQVSVNSFFFY